MVFKNFDYSTAKVSFENSKEKTTKENNTEQLKERAIPHLHQIVCPSIKSTKLT